METTPTPREDSESRERLQQALGLGVVLIAAGALFVASSWDDWFTPHRVAYEEARAYYDARQWPEASEAYEKVADRNPHAGRVWFEYAFAVHSSGDLERAISLHQRASEFPDYYVIARYNLACAYSMLGQADRALDELEALERRRAFQRNLRRSLREDPELDPLRHLERFNALLERVIPPEEGASQSQGGGSV